MANPNPNFLWLFLDRKHSQLNYGVETLTTQLWGGLWMAYRGNAEIWYQDDKGLPDLLSKHGGGDEHTMNTAEITR